MELVKSDKGAKSQWGIFRRMITPKIGQITNDGRAIHDIVRPRVTSLFCPC
jgi:nucleoporin GLE1